jgi:hypothetical protein
MGPTELLPSALERVWGEGPQLYIEMLIRNQQAAGSIPAGGSRTSLKTKDSPELSNLRTLHLSSNCAKTVPKPLHAAAPAPELPFSFAL